MPTTGDAPVSPIRLFLSDHSEKPSGGEPQSVVAVNARQTKLVPPISKQPIQLWSSLASSGRASSGKVSPQLVVVAPASKSTTHTNAPAESVRLATGKISPAKLVLDKDGNPVPVEPMLDDKEAEEQWRESQLLVQTAELKAREAERNNLNRALHRFLFGN
jgi:hypothetical protein